MPKSNKPLTRKDIENAFKGQGFIINKKLDQIRQEMVTKKEAEKFATKEDLKRFATKEDLKRFATKEDLRKSEERIKSTILGEIDKRRSEDKKEILDGVKTMMEVRDEQLQGKHEIELDQVVGKVETPSPWKSIPRRLQTVEIEVEKIKDKLEIA